MGTYEYLAVMGKKKVCNVQRQIEKLREKLNALQAGQMDRREVRQVEDQMNELLYREEMLWLQRSRINWLKGDRNTRFFQNKAVWRARKNKILKLRDTDGNIQTAPDALERMATLYFKEMYTKDPSLDPNAIIQLFDKQVTKEMNAMLCGEFTEEEISNALF